MQWDPVEREAFESIQFNGVCTFRSSYLALLCDTILGVSCEAIMWLWERGKLLSVPWLSGELSCAFAIFAVSFQLVRFFPAFTLHSAPHYRAYCGKYGAVIIAKPGEPIEFIHKGNKQKSPNKAKFGAAQCAHRCCPSKGSRVSFTFNSHLDLGSRDYHRDEYFIPAF